MNFTASWRSIAIAMSCVSLSLAVTLAVVTTQRDLDALATLALALAVISFVVQIILFLAQTATTSQQAARAEEVHGLTTRALTGIEEKTEGTRAVVTTISERMLEAVIGKAVPEATAARVSLNSPEFTQRVSGLIQNQLERETRGTPPHPDIGSSSPKLPPPTLRMPKGDGLVRVIEALRGLTGEDLFDVANLGSDFTRYGDQPFGSIGHGLRDRGLPTSATLRDRGLVTRVDVSWDENPVWVLTELGRDAAGLLLADYWEDFPAEAREMRRLCKEYEARNERYLVNDDPSDGSSE